MKLETELPLHVGEIKPEATKIFADSLESRNSSAALELTPIDDMKSVILSLCNVVIRRSENLQES